VVVVVVVVVCVCVCVCGWVGGGMCETSTVTTSSECGEHFGVHAQLNLAISHGGSGACTATRGWMRVFTDNITMSSFDAQ
jgi:hypothetical protein